MVVWDLFFELGRDQHNLVSGAGRLLPVASVHRFLRRLPASVISRLPLGLIFRSVLD
jgi:hypothetical protein